jgi:hypothetical protein
VVQDLVPIDGGLVLGFVVTPGASGYQVQVRQDGQVVRDYTTTLVGSTRIQGLAGQGSYQVRIRGVAAGGPVTAWSQPVDARPARRPALQVHGTLSGPDRVGVRVTPDPYAQRYQIVAVGPGGGTRTVESAAVDLLRIDGLPAERGYLLTVRTQSSEGWSAPVPIRARTRAADTTPAPSTAPSGVAATAVGGQVTLAWAAVRGAVGYLVTQLDGGVPVDVAAVTTAAVALGAEGDVATNVYVVAAFAAGGLGPQSTPYPVPGAPSPRTVVVTPADTTPDATGVVPYTETGAWLASSLIGVNGEPTRYSSQVGAAAIWSPRLVAAASYLVEIWVPAYSSSSPSARYDIAYDGGTATVTVNQVAVGGAWFALGTWAFAAGHAGTVRLTFTGGSGYARADAVRFTPVR